MVVSDLPFPAAIPRQRWSWIVTQVRNIFIIFLREVFKRFTLFVLKCLRFSYSTVKKFLKAIELELDLIPPMFPPPHHIISQ
jgi:hypothetical protein